MSRTLIERRLRSVSERIKVLQRDLRVVEEQLGHVVADAEDARLQALVSETPIAERHHHEAQRHADAMRRHRDDLLAELRELESSQDSLLDRLVAART